MFNFSFSKKDLGLISQPHFVHIFLGKNISPAADHIPLSDWLAA